MAISVAVRINGELRDYPTDLSVDSTFPIYSITKTLTAICALRLADAGLLRIDVPIQAWLPELELPATVTLAPSCATRAASAITDHYRNIIRPCGATQGDRGHGSIFLTPSCRTDCFFRQEKIGRTQTSGTCSSSTSWSV